MFKSQINNWEARKFLTRVLGNQHHQVPIHCLLEFIAIEWWCSHSPHDTLLFGLWKKSLGRERQQLSHLLLQYPHSFTLRDSAFSHNRSHFLIRSTKKKVQLQNNLTKLLLKEFLVSETVCGDSLELTNFFLACISVHCAKSGQAQRRKEGDIQFIQLYEHDCQISNSCMCYTHICFHFLE